VPGLISQILSTADIMLIVIGIGLLLLGGLMATIYTGVSSMVVQQFHTITNTTVTDYTATTATYVPTILNMLGLTLINCRGRAHHLHTISRYEAGSRSSRRNWSVVAIENPVS